MNLLRHWGRRRRRIVLLRFLVVFPFVPRLFIYMPFVFQLLLPSIFFPFFLAFILYMALCFLFTLPLHTFFPPVSRFLYGLVVVNQRARTKIKDPRQICLIAYNLWSKRVSAPAHSL